MKGKPTIFSAELNSKSIGAFKSKNKMILMMDSFCLCRFFMI